MTPQEAKQALLDYAADNTRKLSAEVLGECLAALNSRIAQYPVYDNTLRVDTCPSCGTPFDNRSFFSPFCQVCGQTLAWDYLI